MNVISSVSPHCSSPDAHALAVRLAALAHPARIAIIRHLAEAECCSCKEVVGRFDLAQSTVSQHLKVLVDAGLVRFTPDSRRSRYELDREALAGVSRSMTALVDFCCEGAPADSRSAQPA